MKDWRRVEHSRKGSCMYKGRKEHSTSEKLKDQLEHSEQSYRDSRGQIT